MAKVYSSAEQLVGNTPLLALNRLSEKLHLRGKLFAKLECFNPGGSAKDRMARAMLDEAEKAGGTYRRRTRIPRHYRDARYDVAGTANADESLRR